MRIGERSHHNVANNGGDHDERKCRSPGQVQTSPLTENMVMIVIIHHYKYDNDDILMMI